MLTDPTIDLDATDIEVFGHRKQRVGWNYAGVKSGRVHLASWAGADLPLAMDLLAGNDDVRPGAPGLLRRALAVLPAAVCGRPRVRADAGYFDGALARAAIDAGCDFAIAAKRNTAVWRASGASRSQSAITKAGNTHARRLLVEAAWHHRQPYRTPSKAIRTRWELAPPAARPSGHAGNVRLHQRWLHFDERNKRPVIANVAVARELAGWCWSLATLQDTGDAIGAAR